jgi:hypothetical protein
VPLWLFAVLDALVVATAILIVSALGGQHVVAHAILGDEAVRGCAQAMGAAISTEGCDPNDWPLMYLYAGVMAFVFFAAWRWTTTKRDR